MSEWTPEEMIVVAAARLLRADTTCFAGIGLPSSAAILAKHLHAPSLFLIYESGTMGPAPDRVPRSVADEVLATTAQSVVSVPEIFNYWLQPGRIDVGVLGTAQVDRYANLDSTVIGESYDHPKVRLPGAGGAPEIAAACKEIIVLVRQSTRTFVERVDFITSLGHGTGAGERRDLGFPGAGPVAVVTDVGVYRPDPETMELTLVELQPGKTLEDARAATGWQLSVASEVSEGARPTPDELSVLRQLDVTEGKRAH